MVVLFQLVELVFETVELIKRKTGAKIRRNRCRGVDVGLRRMERRISIVELLFEKAILALEVQDSLSLQCAQGGASAR